MAVKEQRGLSKKRKRGGGSTGGRGRGEKPSDPKKQKYIPSGSSKSPQAKGFKKSAPNSKPKPSQAKDSKRAPPKFGKSDASVGDKAEVLSKRDSRLVAKELAEARKKKRKLHYTLQQELALLWEKMRRRNIAKDDRSKVVSEALRKMAGKIAEIASSHVSSRVLQTCIKYCSQAEREAVFLELQPHLLALSRNVYGVHLVKKMLDSATKKQLDGFISSLHGKVASLLRHMVGSVVIEHVFQLGNASQKQSLLSELYSAELQLFRDLTLSNGGRLLDIISKLGLQKSSVLQHMSSVIQPILEKGIVDHSIIHTVLIEYLTIADKSSAVDVIRQLSSSLLVRMIHTKDGSKLGILCVKHGDAKERKKIIKGIKEHVGKVAQDQYGSLVLTCILSVVDDTKLLTKVIIRELQKILKELIFDKTGRRPILQLLHPQCPRYLSPDDLASLSLSVPSLCSKGKESEEVDTGSGEHAETPENPEDDSENNLQLAEGGGKKDDALRRYQLLVDSGLAESLIVTCTECAGELLRSNFGREVIYEVVTGGIDGVLRQKFPNQLDDLQGAIASLGALPKMEEPEHHVFENFHSSRTIRKLIMDCPAFAASLWEVALKGKAATWAQGHSAKVVSAFLESPDAKVRDLAKSELQGLVESGALKIPKGKDSKAED
ncbi:unnamed protein product [Spirodela intermedia]|uniref:PUM-HD domain-containing protein n=1 Tax=Spirodela intermedia TaxID=51605 RepID=A0A7I8KLL2_SPIIN|nr:unnamed protein product [Spirodela intermedia]